MNGEQVSEYEGEVAALESGLRDAPPPPGSVVFYGSSSVRLWETLTGDMAPLANGRTVLNLGFGGSELAECAHFFGRTVGRVNAPRSLVVYAGENDLNHGKSAEEVAAAFADLQARVTETFGPLPLAFLGVKPSPGRPDIAGRATVANRLIAAEAAKRPETRFIDTDAPMRGPDGAADPALFIEDGVHLSPAGYAVWTRLVAAHADFLFG